MQRLRCVSSLQRMSWRVCHPRIDLDARPSRASDMPLLISLSLAPCFRLRAWSAAHPAHWALPLSRLVLNSQVSILLSGNRHGVTSIRLHHVTELHALGAALLLNEHNST